MATLASASEQTKKSAASAGSCSLLDPASDLDWDRRPLAEQGERRHEAALGQSRRVDTLRELAQLAARRVELGSSDSIGFASRPASVRSLFEECSDLVEPTLRAESELLLEAPPLRVPGLDDAPA